MTALEQSGPVAPPRVFDFNDNVLGFFDGGSLLFQRNGTWLSMSDIAEDGFGNDTDLRRAWDQTNCQGNAFLRIRGTQFEGKRPLFRTVQVQQGTAYYPGDPAGFVTIQSREVGFGGCFNSTEVWWAGPVVTFDANTLGSQPFRIE